MRYKTFESAATYTVTFTETLTLSPSVNFDIAQASTIYSPTSMVMSFFIFTASLTAGVIASLSLALRPKPNLRIIYSRPSGLEGKAREVVLSLYTIAGEKSLTRIVLKLEPVNEENILEIRYREKVVYRMENGENVDIYEAVLKILEAVSRG